jgi:hypothetical protein
MTATPFMHIALLVEDIEQARAEFEASLGVPFTEPFTAEVADMDDVAGRRPISVRVAYSTVGSPHYELLEAQDDGIFGRQQGLGFHHVGMWEQDCEARRNELLEAGAELEATSYDGSGGILVAWFCPHPPLDLRLEILNEKLRAETDTLIARRDNPAQTTRSSTCSTE